MPNSANTRNSTLNICVVGAGTWGKNHIKILVICQIISAQFQLIFMVFYCEKAYLEIKETQKILA